MVVCGAGGRGRRHGKNVGSGGGGGRGGCPTSLWFVLWTGLGLYGIINWGSGIFSFSSRKQEIVERLRNLQQELDDCNESYNQKNLPGTIENYESDTSEGNFYTWAIVFAWIFTVLFALNGFFHLIRSLMFVGQQLQTLEKKAKKSTEEQV